MRGGASITTKESEANMAKFDRLMETTDREESIRMAMELFPGMTQREAERITDEALAGYRET